jgi:phosphatidyl-myo-inositol dimannoside synthase
VLTNLGGFTRHRLAAAVGRKNVGKLVRLRPGVDASVFQPGQGAEIRRDVGLADRRVVVCVSRLMPRKGQDVLIRALPAVQKRVPDAALLIVGGGPARGSLERLATSTGVRESVAFTGSVPWDALPAYYGAGDVFAMPCRSRFRGLDVEGLGIVFLEAAACGLPVVAGDSGGAPDAVADGVTGRLVDGRSVAKVAEVVASLLEDPGHASVMGARGREWVEREWCWDAAAATLVGLFDE